MAARELGGGSPGYTMMGWMYIPSGDDGGAVCSTDVAPGWGWSLASRSEISRWAIFTGAARNYLGDFVYDTWVHLAGVWDTDKDEVRRYRDGSLWQNVLAIGYDAENQAMTIGSTASRPYEDLDGILDEVIVLEGAWSAEYIEVYYAMTSAPGSWCECSAEESVDASGLALLGLRYYAPRVGRFVMVDPARADVGWYVYVRNLVTARVDSQGLYTDSCADVMQFKWWPELDLAFSRAKYCDKMPTSGGNAMKYRKLARCIIRAESVDNPSEINRGSGARGLFQIIYGWWQGEYEEETGCDFLATWHIPRYNIRFGVHVICRYMNAPRGEWPAAWENPVRRLTHPHMIYKCLDNQLERIKHCMHCFYYDYVEDPKGGGDWKLQPPPHP